MHISKFRIYNYKSFRETNEFDLGPGINVITGQNNAGKTALLEALSLNLATKPHRSLVTIPTPLTPPNGHSSIDVTIGLSKTEFWDLLRSQPNNYSIPVADPSVPPFSQLGITNWNNLDQKKYLRWLEEREGFEFALRFNSVMGNAVPQRVPSFGLYNASRLNQSWPHITYSTMGTSPTVGFELNSDQIDVGAQIASVLRSRIYRFSAERFNIGHSAYGDRTELSPDASNLPEVLSVLQSNHARYIEFVALAQEVLPQIRDISIVPRNGNAVQIWPHDPGSKRIDLSVPLQESGTGIGQVLAILYVVLTSEFGRSILIDEPQSFLHPGAARKLIEVLKRFSRHQFIIATHSPTIIGAADPDRIISLRIGNDLETKFAVHNPTQTHWAQGILAELGTRFSDVFGADNILWVEGQTEELTFPKIIGKMTDVLLLGTNILGVRRVGDLGSKDAERVFDIYSQLSNANTLVPVAIGFIFDRESKTPQQQLELTKKSGKKLRFLPRRMFENYLLNPRGIAAVVSTIPGFSREPIDEAAIDRYFNEHVAERKYYSHAYPYTNDNWRRDIDAARFLMDLFTNLSDARVSFLKTVHSLQLAEWILEHSREDFRELAELLIEILGPSSVHP